MNTADFIRNLLERFKIEHTKRDRSGVYGFTQRLLAYNSNQHHQLSWWFALSL